jgi:hypothetical protein
MQASYSFCAACACFCLCMYGGFHPSYEQRVSDDQMKDKYFFEHVAEPFHRSQIFFIFFLFIHCQTRTRAGVY